MLSLQVCELHFEAKDIEWETSATDSLTGKTITAKLDHPRVKKGALPCKMPNCPEYLSSKSPSSRPSRDQKAAAKHNAQMAQALEESRLLQKREEAADRCLSLAELKEKLQPDLPWSIVHHPTY
jgi:uncharacterized protein YyaL (SSP411 family)